MPWSMTIVFPVESSPLAAKVTFPLFGACTGVPKGAAKSRPECLEDESTLLLYLISAKSVVSLPSTGIINSPTHSFLLSDIVFAGFTTVSYTHLRAHETRHDLVCRLLLEKKKQTTK